MPDRYLGMLEKHVKRYDLFEADEVYVLYSGGKDSTAMRVLLEKYARKHKKPEFRYLNARFPQDVYRDDCPDFCRSARVKESYKVLDREKNPCLLCKRIRRKYIKQMVKRPAAIATGHNTNDLIAYFVEFFDIEPEDIGKRLQKIMLSEKHLEHFSRFFPKLRLNSGDVIIRPMLPFSRIDIRKIIGRRKVIATTCRFESFRPKRQVFKRLTRSIMQKYSPEQLLTRLKNHVTNFESAYKEVLRKDYSSLIF